MKYDASKLCDLIDLRNEVLNNVDDVNRAKIVAFCLVRGLMVPKGFSARFIGFIFRLRRSDPAGRFVLWTQWLLDERMIHIRKDMFDQCINRMVDGRDQSCDLSAGGWNQSELDAFVRFVRDIEVIKP